MGILEQEIAKMEESIDQYDEADIAILYDSIDTITSADCQAEAIEPLLRLFERHPTAYFGDPGPIVSFIERFRGKYESLLASSVKKVPSSTTVWMLNRCINADEHKEAFMDILKETAKRTDVDKAIREQAQDFIEFQKNR